MRDATIEAIRPSSYADDMLKEVRFDQLVDLVRSNATGVHEAFEILQPLLTRMRRVSWGGLVPFGVPWREVVRVIRQLEELLADLPEWSVETIDAMVSFAGTACPAKSLCASRLLYQCLLSSEFRLPLAGAVWHLGRPECVARLDYASRNLELMNLVG